MIRFFACGLLVLGSSFLQAGELTVGFAEVDITPELGKKPVYLAGFGQDRQAKKVHDPIMVRAVVLADGDRRIALVSVDVVGLFNPSTERVRKELPGFKYVLVSTTHNHEGPDTLGLWGANPLQSGVDPEYLKKVEAGCVAAAKAADSARKPAIAKIGTASDPDLIRDTRQPIVKHDEIVAIRFHDPKTDAPLGVLVQWNCHPEVLESKNTEITADFVYYTVKQLRESQKCPVAYFTGTVGGLMTTIRLPIKDEAGKDLQDGTFEKSERYGRLVGKLGEKALAGAKPLALTPFDIRTRELLIPIDNNIYRLAWQFGILDRAAYEWTGTPTPKEFKTTKEFAKPVAVKTEVGYLKLGDLEIAVIPGEIYPELVLGKVQDPADPGADFPTAAIEPALYGQLKGKHKMIVGLGNDEIGYIIPKRQWDEKAPFCYGLKKAQYGEGNSVGPEAAPILCEAFRDLVKAEAEPAKPTSRSIKNIEGWTVRIDDRLLEAPNVELGTRALRFLEAKLSDIKVVVPADKVKKLQAVPIVLDLTHGKLGPMQYHPSEGWLKSSGYAEDLAKCVHLPRAVDVATKRNISEQPWVILHELAHAYHDRVLGFDEPRIQEAYEKFKKSGRGDKTLLFDGRRVKHYGLTNPMEFFAEMTEAYFGANDFFPFNRGELKESEPEIFELMSNVWNAPAKP